MEYKANQEDILKAKKIYDEIIWTQVLNPQKVKEAFKLIFGYDAQTVQQAKIKVGAYFQYTYKAVDSTETTLAKNGESQSQALSVDDSNQSHQEDMLELQPDEEAPQKPKRKRKTKTDGE